MSLFNLASVISMFSTNGTLTVQRPNASTFGAGGFAAAQTFTNHSIPNASVQATTGRDLVKPPEGRDDNETIAIYAPAFALALKDRVTVPGRGVFEVYHVDPWNEAGNFSRGLARQLNSSEPRP